MFNKDRLPHYALSQLIRVMKLTTFFLLIAFITVNAGVYSQTAKLDLKVQSTTVKDILSIIENQSDFFFMYNDRKIDVNRKIDIEFKGSNIETVLKKLFEGTDTKYIIKNRQIVLFNENEAVGVSDNPNTQQQQHAVSGKVTDSTGAPLPGVSVVIKGTTNGTITDMDGKYSLPKVSDNSVLVFSFVGMKSQEVAVGGKSLINVTLADETIGLEEVVAVGYGTQKKSVVTGAISGTNAKELANKPISRIEQALQGRSTGVNITAASGQPGESSTVRVRGTTSINNSDPLYVVDGTPITGNIDYLSPSDIESIEVLKDAASAAIYGARASAGVILVTTKKGTAGTLRISYNGYVGTQSPARKLSLLNASDYATLYNEALTNDGKAALYSNPASLGDGTDWQKAIFSNNSKIENHEISINGGNEKAVFYTSFGYYGQDGIVLPEVSNYKRYNIRINSDFKLKPWLKFGENVSYAHTKSHSISGNNNVDIFSGLLSNAVNLEPTVPSVVTDASIANAAPYSNHIVMRDDAGNPYGISNSYINPLAAAKAYSGNYGASHNITGNFYAEIEPVKNLTLRSSLGAGIIFGESESFTPVVYFNSANDKNLNQYNRTLSSNSTWSLENTASYTFKIEKNNFTALIGTGNYVYNKSKTVSATYNGLPVNTIDEASMNFSVAQANRVAFGFEGYLHKLNSIYGRLIYNYDEKYLFTGIIRRDGSSRFGTNNKFGYFPSASVGWVASKENFWPQNNVVNFLKIRGSYGVTGSDNIGDFQYISTIVGGSNYTYGTSTTATIGSVPKALPNPDLKWEETTQTNVGFEATVLKDFRLTFDWFNKTTSNMLMTIQLPYYTGASSFPSGNVATMKNTGVEIDLSYRKAIGALNFEVKGNASYVKNEITDLGQTAYLAGPTSFSSQYEITRTMVGMPYASFYGFVSDGIFQNQAQIDAYTNKAGAKLLPNAKPGDFKWVDVNGDGAISSDDRTFLGSSIPKWNYGLTISASWKNFDVNIFGQGVAGNKIYNNTRRVDIPASNWATSALDRWHGEGTSNTFPRMSLADPNHNFNNTSAFYLKDGAFVRLKSVQLGYTLPKNLASKAKFEKVRIYVTGTNLFTITKYTGFDPEVGGSLYGFDQGIYPQAKSFMIGLNVTL